MITKNFSVDMTCILDSTVKLYSRLREGKHRRLRLPEGSVVRVATRAWLPGHTGRGPLSLVAGWPACLQRPAYGDRYKKAIANTSLNY
jgi:hypothetical protein